MTKTEGFVPGRHRIEDYGGGGFRFADMSHRGSILATPSGVRALALSKASEIDAEPLALVLNDPAGRADLLIVGTGAAVRTYNMLLDEGRRVAALLIAV